MPNWCFNTLEVSGDPEQLKEFKETVRGTVEDKEVPLSLDSLVPMPEELRKVSSPPHIVPDSEYEKAMAEAREREKRWPGGGYEPLTEQRSQTLTKRFGANNWYDWALKNWGTKWDAWDAEVTDEENDHIVYQFVTAWSPPLEWLETVAKPFPSLGLTLTYEDEFNNFSGEIRFEDGVETYHKEEEPDENAA
jgi:hypothetical protein